MAEILTWITAQSFEGTAAICAEVSSERTIDRFLGVHAAAGIVNHIRRPNDRAWDGSPLTAAEKRRLNAGLRRNG